MLIEKQRLNMQTRLADWRFELLQAWLFLKSPWAAQRRFRQAGCPCFAGRSISPSPFSAGFASDRIQVTT